MSKRSNKDRQWGKRSSNRHNVALNGGALETIIPVSILLVFLVICMTLIINNVSTSINTEQTVEVDIEAQIWEQAFIEAEKNKVGIIFGSISTSQTEYEQLREKCTKFIEETSKTAEATVSVDTVVEEKQYVDGGVQTTNIVEDANLAETGPIYFQDMLMLRYINSNGEMHVVASVFNPINKTDIRIITRDELVDELNKLNINTSLDITEQDTQYDWTSETEYLKEIDSTVKSMLLASTQEEIRKAEQSSIKYFTLEGNQMVFGNRDKIEVAPTSRIRTVYIAAGKSDTSKTYKDRIYMNIELMTEEKTTEIYMILKLNSNYRIFDIDII